MRTHVPGAHSATQSARLLSAFRLLMILNIANIANVANIENIKNIENIGNIENIEILHMLQRYIIVYRLSCPNTTAHCTSHCTAHLKHKQKTKKNKQMQLHMTERTHVPWRGWLHFVILVTFNLIVADGPSGVPVQAQTWCRPWGRLETKVTFGS